MSKVTQPLFQKHFLVGFLLLSLTLLFFFVSPFLTTLFMAGVIVTAVHPLKQWLEKKWNLPPSLMALLLMILIVVVVLVPLSLFTVSVVDQAGDAYDILNQRMRVLIRAADYDVAALFSDIPLLQNVVQRFLETNPLSFENILSTIGSVMGSVSGSVVSYATGFIRHITVFVIHAVIFFVSLFYFLRDGEKIVHYVRSLLPLSKEYRDELFHKMYQLMHSIIFGIFGSAIAQAILLGIALALAGIENAVFWSAIGAVLAPIPYIGIGLVWVPIAAALLMGQHFVVGGLFILWCVLVVANADNVVKPYIIGSSTALHPLAILVVMLGGAFAFGFRGLIFGPMILTVSLSLLHIYRLEYAGSLRGQSHNSKPKNAQKL